AVRPASFSEGAGVEATTATVSRGAASPRSLTVRIENGNPAVVTAPPSVVIPAGFASISFPIAAVDNSIVDGSRTASIRAFAEATGFTTTVGQTSPVTLTVTDDDGPSLT